MCAGLRRLEEFGIFRIHQVREDKGLQQLLKNLRRLSLSTATHLTGVCPSLFRPSSNIIRSASLVKQVKSTVAYGLID